MVAHPHTLLALFLGLCLSFGSALDAQPLFPNEDSLPSSPTGFQFRRIVPTAAGFVVEKANHGLMPSALFLEAYDALLQKRATRQVSLVQGNLIAQVLMLREWDEQLCLISTLQQAEAPRRQLLIQRFEPLTLEPRDEGVLLESWSAPRRPSEFRIAFSENGRRLSVFGWERGYDEDPARLHLAIYDADLVLLERRVFLLPWKNANLELVEALNDGRGNHYLTVRHYTGKSRHYRSNSKYVFRAIHYREGASLPTMHSLTVPGRVVDALRFALSPQGHFIAAGFYRKKLTYNWEGYCFFRLDPQTGALHHHPRPIDKKTFRRAYDRHAFGYKAPWHPLRNYFFRQLLVGRRGEAYLVAEFFDQGLVTSGSRQGVNDFLFDVLVLKLSPEGQLLWMSRIPKLQAAPWPKSAHFSYVLLDAPEQLYFLFNDTVRNHSRRRRPGRLRLYDGRHTVPILVEMSKYDGMLEFFELPHLQEEGFFIVPRLSITLSSGRFLLFHEKSAQGRLSYFMRLLDPEAWISAVGREKT